MAQQSTQSTSEGKRPKRKIVRFALAFAFVAVAGALAFDYASTPNIARASTDPATAEAAPGEHVVFPEGKRPSESPIYTHNEFTIEAAPEQVWAWLIRAQRWPEWYGNAKDVELEGGAPDLALGTNFDWTTFGVRAHTRIEEFVPNRRLAWSGQGVLGATAYHGWVITPREGGGCVVVTEETQQGIVPSVGRSFLRSGLVKWHQRWLEGLAKMAARGNPDGSASAKRESQAQ
jgi:hypothetical protein